MKIVKLKDETHDALSEIGSKRESFDDIIKKCIEAYKELARQKQKK